MAKVTRKKKPTELVPEPDPAAALESALFLRAAAPVLGLLKADLSERAKASAAVTRTLVARHQAEKEARRTADGFAQWQERFIEQVAAAWLLSAVFVRTLEDRGLLGQARIAGPGAMDSQKLFFEMAPSLSERDYLLTVFRELGRFSAASALFDARHNPVWLLGPSAEATKALFALFRAPDAEAPAFRFGQADTRFLGDLYQDLDEGVRKRFALLQTPRFVESFILDRTLERAVERFGLDDTTLVDPTCGSGHFLLGAFARLFAHRREREPGLGVREAAHKALDAVYGADINPYAVAIARFRLTLAFLETAGYARLRDAPALPLHVAVADSLLHNPQLGQTELMHLDGQSAAAWQGEEYALEDEQAARGVLHRRYAAVVGNPPYITVKDAVLRDRYRDHYESASMQYSLAAPFCERFFQLARDGGAVGMITANSFMKREFGKKLIEKYLPTVNLDLIVNTSGAYIPGHGTPTVLLFGTAEAPKGNHVHAVLAKRGEPTTPANAEQGEVWRSIADHFGATGFENDYISVAEVECTSLAKHPWSLGGGGASELKALLEERAEKRLRDVAVSIGRVAHTGNDEAYVAPFEALRRRGVSDAHIAAFVEGEIVRDWALGVPKAVLFPYDRSKNLETCDERLEVPHFRWLWPYRTMLWERREPNGTHREIGLTWYEFSRFHPERFVGPCIAFAFVATHNHFVLDRGGRVFNRSAPIIKLPAAATEDDHYALLAYLNSSTACFWMKQVFFDKGNRGEGGGLTSELWEKFYEFDGTKLRELPLPAWTQQQRDGAIRRARRLSELATARAELLDLSDLFATPHDDARALHEETRARHDKVMHLEQALRAAQEQLDWWVYSTVGLANGTHAAGADLLEPGARACDVLYARSVLEGSATARYLELCRLPDANVLSSAEWERKWGLSARLDAIRGSKMLSMIETPVCKRTFREGFRTIDPTMQYESWLATRLEGALISMREPARASTLDVREIEEIGTNVREVLKINAVPFVAQMRFAPTGLVKYHQWQEVWQAQRDEDEGARAIERPAPKYAPKDFGSANYFRLRGKLDVPKERFISYPGCESDEDGEPLYGWAGWNHLERAQALAALYQQRKNEGWQKDRLTPMLAGLLELVPWVKQWHNEPSAEYNGLKLGDYFASFVAGECSALGLTEEDLTSWRPADKKGRAAKNKAGKKPGKG